MKLRVMRYSLEIIPQQDYDGDNAQDVAFIEEVLGLRADGDAVKLVRRNAMGLGCIAYLETQKEKETP